MALPRLSYITTLIAAVAAALAGAGPAAAAFEPVLSVSEPNTAAGAFSPLSVGVERPDGQPYITALTVALPPGLLATIRDAQPCRERAAAAGTCGGGRPGRHGQGRRRERCEPLRPRGSRGADRPLSGRPVRSERAAAGAAGRPRPRHHRRAARDLRRSDRRTSDRRVRCVPHEHGGQPGRRPLGGDQRRQAPLHVQPDLLRRARAARAGRRERRLERRGERTPSDERLRLARVPAAAQPERRRSPRDGRRRPSEPARARDGAPRRGEPARGRAAAAARAGARLRERGRALLFRRRPQRPLPAPLGDRQGARAHAGPAAAAGGRRLPRAGHATRAGRPPRANAAHAARGAARSGVAQPARGDARSSGARS